jgi:hypothetical protein
MQFADAADAERLGLEFWAHAWLTVEGARWWRQLLAERFRDEVGVAMEKRARGDRSDVWGECRRLAAWCSTLDEDMAWRGLAIPYRRGGRPVKAPPLWRLDECGRIELVRHAEHWHREGGRVRCALCYRRHMLGPGDAWLPAMLVRWQTGRGSGGRRCGNWRNCAAGSLRPRTR